MIAFFTRHPTAANLLMLAMLVLGVSSLSGLKRETFPEFAPPYVSINAVYPGASAKEVEQELCLRIEEAMDGLSNIDEVRCESLEGVAEAKIKLNSQAPLSRMLLDIQTQIDAIDDFPQALESVVVQELDWKEPVIDIAISAPLSLPELKLYAEQLKRELKQQMGVALVTVTGFSDHLWRVDVDPLALRQLGMSVAQIADQLGGQIQSSPAGTLSTAQGEFLIRFGDAVTSVEDLNALVVAADEQGRQVRLGEIARIDDQFELAENKILFDDKPAAVLKIYKRKSDDALDIKAKVAEFVEQQRQFTPTGVTLTLSNDLSSVLWDRLSMMIKNGAQGIVLVFLCMWLFFSFRYSLWVALGLPAAFLGGLFLMAQLGLSINVMSLVGLLMAIGIMMDDSIVIAESVASHIDRGQPLEQAVVNGVTKVLPGVMSSFLTTLCIFGGLLFLDGQMGAVLKAVPQVLILVLALSLIEAFWILPHHLATSLRGEQNKRSMLRGPWPIKTRLLSQFERFRQGALVRAVDAVLRYRYLFLACVLASLLFALAAVIGGIVRFQPFPTMDGDVIEARVTLPPGTPLSQTESLVAKIAAGAKQAATELSRTKEGGRVLLRHLTEQYNHNADANESGPHLATVRLDLLTAEARHTTISEFIAHWRDAVGELAGPIAVVYKQPAMGPGGRAVDFRMMHDDLNVLKQASLQSQHYLRSLGLNGVVDSMRLGKPEYVLTLKANALRLGLNRAEVAEQIRSALLGITANERQWRGESIDIEVRIADDKLDQLSELENLPIQLADGQFAPLSALVEIQPQRDYVAIERIDGRRAISVYAETYGTSLSSTEVNRRLSQDLQPRLQAEFPGLRFASDGEAKDAAQTGQSMAKGFLLGLFGVFVILSYQFRSYIEPLVVMLAIPLALIGVIVGHGLLGYPLSMPSVMGFISLAGIVVNDSILLVQYIRHHLQEGEPLHQSLILASRERFRAVFLTSVTTAAGLLPLLFEPSLQAQVLKPLVIAIVFGVFSSTLLVIFMVPAAYQVLDDFELTRRDRE
ncbi:MULTISPECIES: efflux RND transporter permease subunit [unclassified Vibrio]|uniref:Efflux RND transporter permease subunit n=1 Tax=Vibrio sp. HB236076 TaxID=3232307 RepID=A0AB39HHF4_9VIBR|nr:efflux RND transporter permease subunit [Vibrio sp. HB161653]MDP5254381.1 efflux RND transporter permease subunit [Vibrio sp. HB161653]